MKKVLIVLCILILCACSSNISWTDAEAKYNDLANNTTNIVEESTNFLKNDYLTLLNELKDNVDKLESGINKDNEVYADKIYETAIIFEKASSLFNNEQSTYLKDLSNNLKNLVMNAYNKDSNFDETKTTILENIDEILNWDNDTWSNIEKYETINWQDVSSQYEQLEQETINNLLNKRNVTEIDLEQLHNTIIDNYEDIATGVTKNNEQTAKDIYVAALQLYKYTENIDQEATNKVNLFALNTMEYVKNCYGKQIELEGYSFPSQVETAKKWSLSLWNELTALFKRY